VALTTGVSLYVALAIVTVAILASVQALRRLQRVRADRRTASATLNPFGR